MTDKKDALLEAHVRFELDRLTGDNLPKTLAEEVAAFFESIEHLKLNEVVSAAQVVGWIRRYVIEAPPSPGTVDHIKAIVVFVAEFLKNDPTRLEEIVPQSAFEQFVDTVAGLQDLRRDITHQLVSNSVYAGLISHVLYYGIKQFVLTENILAKNIPGASSLVRFGQNALNAATPRLEKGIDRQLISFIHANIQDTIRNSEQFLNATLDAKLMRTLGQEVWATNAKTEMSQVAGYVDTATLETMVEIALNSWLQRRATPLFAGLLTEMVDRFFLDYGEKDVRSLLDDVGITQEMATSELTALATPVVEKALRSGIAEKNIRRRLDAFYTAYFAP